MLLKHEEQGGGARDAEGGRLLSFSSPFAVREAYVKLRTNLMFCVNAKGDPCTTFVVTSPNPSEGKSLTAANIASSASYGPSIRTQQAFAITSPTSDPWAFAP